MKKIPYHFHKMVWLFFIASILGFVFESIYCFILHGTIESRSGLIYGPFSQIYSFAAVIVILLLQKTNFKNRWSLNFPMKMSTLVTWIIILFMTFDLSISAAAVFRANQRYDGIPPTNSIQTFLDRSYPDSFIHQVYPNMVHVS